MEKLNNACVYAYVHGKSAVSSLGRKAKERVLAAANDESGMEIIAIILILVIVIGLIIIFRDNIMDIFTRIWDAIFGESEDVINNPTGNNGG